MSEHVVTIHAVVRWMQRIVGIGEVLSRRYPDGASDYVLATYGCQVLGISLAQAREAVCPRRYHAGIAMGAQRIIAHDRIGKIKHGRVTTIVSRDMPPKPLRPEMHS